MFDKPIVKVEKKDGVIWMHEGNYGTCKTNLDCFKRFPAELFGTTEDKHAALTYLTCNDALAYLQPMIQYLLKGTLPHQSIGCSREKR